MKLKKQFSNLKKGAKKVFVGMLVLCLISTATGIGSIFAYAQNHEGEEHAWEIVDIDSNNSGSHTLTYRCSIPGCDEEYTESQNCSYTENTDVDGNKIYTCACGYSYTELASQPQPDPEPDTDTDTDPDPEVEHHYEYIDDQNGATHTKRCTDEGCTLEPTTEGHTYENGVCVCGASDPDDVPAQEHHFEYIDDENGATHTKRCTDEGCNFTPVQESHDYVDGVCVCGATDPDNVPAQEHHFDYIDDRNGETHTKVCTDAGCDFEPVHEEHTFSNWVYCGNGMHERTCACGFLEREECSIGGWEPDGQGNHVKKCALCGEVKETEPCTFDENGNCTVCGVRPRLRLSRINIPTPTSEGLVEGFIGTAGAGPITFAQFFETLPTVNSGLVYNAESQELEASRGTTKSEEYMAEFGVESGWGVTTSSATSAIDAGSYQIVYEITYTYKDAEGTSTVYTATGTYTVEIAKASFANDVDVTPETSSFVEMKSYSAPYYRLSINGHQLARNDNTGYAYTATESANVGKEFSKKYVGSYCTYTFYKGQNNTNFDNSTIVKKLIVEDISPTFNGSTAQKESYHGTVTVLPPTGYSVARHAGTTDEPETFVNELVLDASMTPLYDNELFFKYNGTNQIIRKPVTISIVAAGTYTLDDIVSAFPEFYSTLTYTGSEQNLMSTAPVLNSTFLNAHPEIQVTWGFEYKVNGQQRTTQSPVATDIGLHEYKFFVKYTPEGQSTETLYVNSLYRTYILKDIGYSSITYTPYGNAADYQSLDSSKTIYDYYVVKDGTEPLQRNIDYSITADQEAAYYETGKNITLTYTGLKNDAYFSYYGGTVTKTIPVSTVNVLLNGAAQVAKYNDAVKFTAAGYTISDRADGIFNTEYTYAASCTNLTLPLYFKKDGTSRVVQQNIVGLTIGDAADITLLYDGSTELKPRYYDSVRISATGYTVSKTQTGEFDENYPLNYTDLHGAKNDPVATFDLYFKNKSTGIVTLKRVSDIYLYQSPTIDVYYNGEGVKDWYSGNVTITAKDTTTSPVTIYKIASEKNKDDATKYAANYVMSGSGTVSEKLYFIPRDATTATAANWKAFTIAVTIDKTAPSGVINLASYSSDSFTSEDSVKAYTNGSQKATISASDDLSGVDYIHFYVSDTFYSSPSDVNASIKEKSGAWRTYSSSSQPTTVKDKNNYIYAKIVDKAGNENIISLGSIIYDTVAPKMTTAKVTASSNDTTKSLIGFAGTDKLSGINRFKYYYREKEEGRKYDTPGKDWMFDNGEYVKTSNEKDGTSVASTSIDVLDAAKTYLFYFIAVDRADNISEVMTQEVKGDSAAAKSDMSSQGASGKSGASGLTPSPSGIAGSGSGSGKQGGSGSSSKSSKDKTSKSALGDKDREINRNPYIAEATGNVKIGINETSGWNKIASEVNKADKGAVIEVEMAGLSNVPNELFNSMNNRDVQVKLRMPDEVEWEIKGEEVPNARSDIDMGVRLGSRNIPEQILTDVAGTNPHVEFSINHDGDFGFVATIAVPVGESNKGMYTTLYHYDEEKKELEVAGDGRVDDKGYTKFPLTHASDYTVVITPERILSAADADAETATLVGAEEDQSSTYLDGARLRLTDLFRVRGSMRIWLFIIALLSAAICLIILYLPALQLRNQNDQGDLF